MKKVWVFLVLCGMLLSLTACDTVRFKSETELLTYLEGVWVETSSYAYDEYYIFRDGKLYLASDGDYLYCAGEAMEKVLEEEGVGGLSSVTHADVASATNARVLAFPSEDIQIRPKEGKIITRAGSEMEEYIIVKKDQVVLQRKDQESWVTLEKFGDSLDFKGEHFLEVFKEYKQEYTVPKENMLISAEEYEEFLKGVYPQVNNWLLCEKNETYTRYTDNGWATSNGGEFVRAKNRLGLSIGYAYNEMGAPFQIVYTLEDDSEQFEMIDRNGQDLTMLLAHAGPILKSYPGTKTPSEITSLFYEKCKQDGDCLTMRYDDGSVVYTIEYDMYKEWTYIAISFLSDVPYAKAVAHSSTS